MKPALLILKAYLFLSCIILGTTLQGMKKQDEENKRTSSWKSLDPRLASWPNALEQYAQGEIEQETSPRLASRERLRKSAITKGMREWQENPAQSVPKTPTIQGCQIKLEDTITDAVLVPYTKKVLMSAFNRLYRVDMETKSTQALAFARPITKLIQSADGSLCAVLLEPSEDDYPLIHFVNSCKSLLELNTDIKPISYYQTEEYELGQEADLSTDARYLAAIINQNTACIYDLKTNALHATLQKNEQEFPLFSLNFLKNNTCAELLPPEQHKLAVHANLETTIHLVDQDGCTVLQKIDHRPQVTPKFYCPRQSAWILPGRLIVLLDTKLLAFNLDEQDAFELAKSMRLQNDHNELLQCNTNRIIFIEFNKAKKKILLHNFLDLKSCVFSNPTNDHVFMDESDTMSFIARKNALMLVIKKEFVDDIAKKSSYPSDTDDVTE